MFRSKVVFIFIFILAIFSVSGCDFFQKTETIEVQLQLSGFPYEHETYYIEIYDILNGSEPTTIKTIPGVSSTQTLQEKLSVDVNASSLVVYLFTGPGEEKPVYFTTFAYDSTIKSYTVVYWLDYASYTEGIETFGISSNCIRTIESGGIAENLDFGTTPYYLYQVNDAQNNSLTIRLNMTQGNVNFSYGNSLALGTATTYTGQKVISLNNYPDEELYILLTPGAYELPAKGKATIETHQQVAINGTITDMTAGDQPDRIYATARVAGTAGDSYRLYYINPVEKRIDNEFTLPVALNPTAIVYSALTQKLYILSSSMSGTVGIWDPATESITTYQYAPLAGGRDICVDPLNHYLYIATTAGLYIVDMDNPATVLKSYPSMNLYNIDLDMLNQRLFGAGSTYIYRFALTGTQVAEAQKISVPIVFGSKILLSPEKRKLYYLNATTESIISLEASNLLNKSGSWQLEYTPDDLSISPDGSILYAVDGGTVGIGSSTYLYAFNEHTPEFGIIRKFPFLNTASTALLAVNSDGSVLAGYSNEYNAAVKQYNSTITFYINIHTTSTLSINPEAYQLPVSGNNYAIF